VLRKGRGESPRRGGIARRRLIAVPTDARIVPLSLWFAVRYSRVSAVEGLLCRAFTLVFTLDLDLKVHNRQGERDPVKMDRFGASPHTEEGPLAACRTAST